MPHVLTCSYYRITYTTTKQRNHLMEQNFQQNIIISIRSLNIGAIFGERLALSYGAFCAHCVEFHVYGTFSLDLYYCTSTFQLFMLNFHSTFIDFFSQIPELFANKVIERKKYPNRHTKTNMYTNVIVCFLHRIYLHVPGQETPSIFFSTKSTLKCIQFNLWFHASV